MFDGLANYISEVVRGKKVRINGQNAQWRKVANIKVGDRIAVTAPDFDRSSARLTQTEVEFDEIVSIKRLSPERVYDIEVEGTHNFVAGHFIDRPAPEIATEIAEASPNETSHKRDMRLKNQGNSGSGTFGGIIAHNTYVSGNIGIGDSTPATKLSVVGNMQIGYAQGTPTQTNGLAVSGNVGIGTTTPTAKLEVNGSIKLGGSDNIILNNNFLSGDGGDEGVFVHSSGNVGIGTTNPSGKLHVSGSVYGGAFYDTVGSNAYFLIPSAADVGLSLAHNIYLRDTTPYIKGFDGTSTYNALILQGANASNSTSVCISYAGEASEPSCAGKLDAGTVDPPYTINGKKYATYMASMTGQKEETTGTVTTKSQDTISKIQTNSNYQTPKYEINFNNQEEDSDLWLFSKTTNLRENIDKMTVLLTPADNTRTWYKVDKENYTLTIYSSRPTTISYRLTAPRFDYEMWANRRPDNASGGFVIDDPDTPITLTDNGDVAALEGVPYAEIIKSEIRNSNIETSSNYQNSNSLNTASDSALVLNLENSNLDIVSDFVLRISDFNVKLNTGELVDEFVAGTNAFFGKVTAGLIDTQNAIIKNILIAQDIVANKIYVSEKIKSPIVETDKIVTHEIRPKNNDLVVNLEPTNNPESTASVDKGALARLIIKGLEGKTAASIDSLGNATFSGTLAAADATISGTLAATRLEGQEATISGTLIAQNIEAENIKALEENLTANRDAIASLQHDNGTMEQLNNDVNDIQKLLADIKNNPLPDADYYQNVNTNVGVGSPDPSTTGQVPSGNLAGAETVPLQDLTVTGNSNLYNLSVSGSALIGQTLIENNSILALASDLKLSALNTITLFDGAVVIAKDGSITMKGELIAQGGVKTNDISAVDSGDDINVHLSSNPSSPSNPSKFSFRNSSGDEVAAVDSSGSARFKDLALDTYLDATQSGAIIAAADNFNQNGIDAPAIETETKAAGNGILPAGSPEIIIYNYNIKENSLIYLTPTTPNSPTLTVVQKTIGDKPYFKIAIDKPVTNDVHFNWLIIN